MTMPLGEEKLTVPPKFSGKFVEGVFVEDKNPLITVYPHWQFQWFILCCGRRKYLTQCSNGTWRCQWFEIHASWMKGHRYLRVRLGP